MAYKVIVCGVTGSAHSQKAALEAALLAGRDNARLIYVYAVDDEFFRTGRAVELSHHAIADSLERLGTHIVDHAVTIAQTQGVGAEGKIVRGSALEVLRKVVAEEKADLLVLGHEKRTFLEKALFKGEVEDHVEELKKQTGVEVNVVR